MEGEERSELKESLKRVKLEREEIRTVSVKIV